MGYIFQYHTHPITRTKISLKSYILQTQQRFCYSLYCMLMRNSLIWWRSLRTFAIGCIIVSGYVSSLTLKLPVLLLGLIGTLTLYKNYASFNQHAASLSFAICMDSKTFSLKISFPQVQVNLIFIGKHVHLPQRKSNGHKDYNNMSSLVINHHFDTFKLLYWSIVIGSKFVSCCCIVNFAIS